MTNPGLAESMEQLRERLAIIQHDQAKASERFEKLDTMQADISAVEASVTSKDRAVTVIAGPGGSVKSVRFTDDVKRLTPNQLSESVTSTIQQAVAEAARQQAAVIQSYVGDQIDIVDRVMKTQEQLLGHALAPEGVPQPPPVRGPASEVDEEDELPVLGLERPAPPRASTPRRPPNDNGVMRF